MLNLLNSIMMNTESELKRESAEIILDMLDENMTNKEILDTVYDIVCYGCASGMVPALIYYSDTEPFFDRHADEIFELIEDMSEEGKIDKKQLELSKNSLAWLGFETMAYEIYDELETAYSFISDEDGNEY